MATPVDDTVEEAPENENVKPATGRTEEPAVDDADVIGIVKRCRRESFEARQQRAADNANAWRVVNQDIDFSAKQPGQSTLVLPDLARGLEQAGGVVERELTTNTNWFQMDDFEDVPPEIIDADTLTKLTQHMLRNLHQPGYFITGSRTFEGVLSDAIKLGMVEGEIVLKIAPVCVYRKVVKSVPIEPKEQDGDYNVTPYNLKQQRLEIRNVKTLKLDISAVPFEDSFPDCSGSNSWFIHETTVNVCDLEGNSDFDQDAVSRLKGKVAARDEMNQKQSRENQSILPHKVGTVRMMEFWGDLVAADGEVKARNVLCNVAEDELLRKPMTNPLYSKSFPFVRGQLRRAPLGEVHPAFIDLAIDPYLAEIELFNALLDAAKQSVGGVYQIRPDMVENEADLSGGIPPGFRARLKRAAGANKFYERCDEQVQPQHASMMLSKLGSARETALAIPDVQLASQAGEQQRPVTETIATQEGSTSFFEMVANRLEDSVIEPGLKLSALLILQYLDDLTAPDIVRILGQDRAFALAQLSPEERFELLSGAINIRATGLREMTGRVRELRKLTSVFNIIGNNPSLMQVYDANFSYKRTLSWIMRSLGVDTTTIEKRANEGPELDPNILAAQAGMGGPQQTPDANAAMQSAAPPNPTGERGVQYP